MLHIQLHVHTSARCCDTALYRNVSIAMPVTFKVTSLHPQDFPLYRFRVPNTPETALRQTVRTKPQCMWIKIQATSMLLSPSITRSRTSPIVDWTILFVLEVLAEEEWFRPDRGPCAQCAP